MKKIKIKKGDQVKVISGSDKGLIGEVLKIFKNKNKVLVKGINIIKKHTKPSTKNPQGGIINKESPIDISNILLLDPNLGIATKIKYICDSDGKKRISKKSGEII